MNLPNTIFDCICLLKFVGDFKYLLHQSYSTIGYPMRKYACRHFVPLRFGGSRNVVARHGSVRTNYLVYARFPATQEDR